MKYCYLFLVLFTNALFARERHLMPDCSKVLSAIQNPLSALEIYLSKSEAKTTTHRFFLNGVLGPPKLVVPVDRESFPLFVELMGSDPHILEQVAAPNYYMDLDPGYFWPHHLFFRWMGNVYDMNGEGLRQSEWRFSENHLSVFMLLSDSEAGRFQNFMELLADKSYTSLRYPHLIEGYGYPQDPYCHTGHCGGWFWHAPLGDKVSNEVVVSGSLDNANRNRRIRLGTLREYPVPKEHEDLGELVKRVWSVPKHESLLELLGLKPEDHDHRHGSAIAAALLTKANHDRTPFVVLYTDDRKNIPTSALGIMHVEEVAGGAIDVAVAPGKVIKVGTQSVGGGMSPEIWSGTGWTTLSGGILRAAAGNGELWALNRNMDIFVRPDGQEWQHVGGKATDIGVGPKGDVYVISVDRIPEGFNLYQFQREQGIWRLVEGGGGIRVGVGPEGPWVVQADGKMKRLKDGQWLEVPAPWGADIAVSPSGTVWIVGGEIESGGFRAYYLNKDRWVHLHGIGGTNIDAGSENEVWITTNDHHILRVKLERPRN